MATVTPTQTIDPGGDGSLIKWTWALTTANDVGLSVDALQWADRTWSAVGTWGGATLTLQGSNDDANFLTMGNALTGNPATAATDALITTFEGAQTVRPKLTTPGAGAAVTVVMVARRASPLRA